MNAGSPDMRSLLLIPASLALTTAAGVSACAALGRSPHSAALLVAAAATLLASLAGIVPLLLTRGFSQLVVTQAALVGSMLHLFLSAVAAVVVVLGHVQAGTAFLAWLLAMYAATLVALVFHFARAIRSAPPAAAPTSPSPKA